MKRNILVLLTCSLGMTAWGETHVLDGAQSSNSIVYVARYSYDDMGNMVLRRWVPNYASLRMEDGGDSPEELRNLVERRLPGRIEKLGRRSGRKCKG